MASSNFNAGSSKFPQFNNVGGPKPKKTNTTGQGPKDSPSVQNDPQETMQFGTTPVADAKTDTVSTGTKEVALEATPTVIQSTPSSIPTQIDGLNIAGMSGSSGVKNIKFDGIATQGTKITSLETGDKVLASVNPLRPVTPKRQPTSSVGFVMSTFEDTELFTTGGAGEALNRRHVSL